MPQIPLLRMKVWDQRHSIFFFKEKIVFPKLMFFLLDLCPSLIHPLPEQLRDLKGKLIPDSACYMRNVLVRSLGFYEIETRSS